MSYKTILVHVDQSTRAEHVAQLASRLALAAEGHLVGVACTGIDRLRYQYSGAALGMPVGFDDFPALTERAERALDGFEAAARRMGVTAPERRRVDDEGDIGLTLQSRYCDLLVLGQPDPDQPSRLPQELILHIARPVLMVPFYGQFEQVGNHPLLAWDGGMEATRAITAALPLLRRAREVTLAVFNAQERHDVHGEQPGADMALYLARHGVKVTVEQRTTSLDVGEALLSMAADAGADLLVMGCYGHHRLRELVLGGASRTVLRAMTLPVLMAH